MWKHLTHPNIVPLLGVTITPLQLISDWMPGGELREYLKNNPDAKRLKLVGPFGYVYPLLTPVTSYPALLRASATFTRAT